MKKIIAGLISGAMLLQCGVSVFAYDFLKIQPPEWISQMSDTLGDVGLDSEVKNEGEVSLFMTTTSKPNASGDVKVYQNVEGLEAAGTYVLTFWSKAENVSSFKFVRSSFYSTNISNSRTSWDWEKHEIEFTLGKNSTTAEIRFTLKNASSGEAKVWVDNCSLVKKGTTENLLLNPDFEQDVDLIAPAAVTNVSASAKEGSCTITWTDPADEDFRKVYIYDGEILVGEVDKGVCEFKVSGLENGIDYVYDIYAADAIGNRSEKVSIAFSPKAQRSAPQVSADDENNVIIGIDSDMEYSMDGGAWVSYSSAPNLSGCHIVYVRYKATADDIESKSAVLFFLTNKEVVAGSLSASLKNNRRNISYQGSASDEKLTAVVQPKGSAPYVDIAYIKEISVTEGSFSEAFVMPETAERGIYELIINSSDTDDALKLEFSYVPDADIEEYIGEVVSNADAEDLLSDKANEEVLKAIGINTDDLYKLDDLSAMTDALKNAGDVDIEEFTKIVGQQTAIGLIEDAKPEEVVGIIEEYNEEYLGLEYEDKGWGEIDDNARKAFISEYLAGKDLSKTLEEEYEMANILYDINDLSYSTIEGVIEKYAEELGVEGTSAYSKFNSMNNSKKTTVLKAVKTASDSYTSKEEFADAFEDAVKDADKKTTTGGGGGGSSSGGSSGSTVSRSDVTSWVPINKSEKTEPVEENKQEEKLVFDDLNDAEWAKEAITTLYNMNIVSGMGDGIFKPNASVTREQFVKMAAEAFEITINEESLVEFTDVSEDRWSYPAVSAMASNELIFGYSEGDFRPTANITREDLAVIIVRICEYAGINLPKTREVIEFADGADISEYAKSGIEKLYRAGILNGVDESNIAPKNQATRAMAAKVIYSVMEVQE